MRRRARGVGAVTNVSAIMTSARHREMKPGAARKARAAGRTAGCRRRRASVKRIRRATMRSSRNSAGQIRNGPNTLGSLNAPSARPMGANRSRACRERRNSRRCRARACQHRGEHIGDAHGGQPRHRVLREQAGEQNAGDRQIDRRAGVLRGLFARPGTLSSDIRPPTFQTSSSSSGTSRRAVEAHAGDQAATASTPISSVMRRGLDEGDRARQHGDEQHDEQQPLAQRTSARHARRHSVRQARYLPP